MSERNKIPTGEWSNITKISYLLSNDAGQDFESTLINLSRFQVHCTLVRRELENLHVAYTSNELPRR